VLNNDVYETKEKSGGNAQGIYIYIGDGSVVTNNRVGNQAFGTGNSFGIYIEDSSNLIVKSNIISRMEWGILFEGSTGLYGDNLVSGCTTPFTAVRLQDQPITAIDCRLRIFIYKWDW